MHSDLVDARVEMLLGLTLNHDCEGYNGTLPNTLPIQLTW